MKKILFISALLALFAGCFHGKKGAGEPAPPADTLTLSPDTTLILEDAPAEEILDEFGNISADPVVAEAPVVQASGGIDMGGVVEGVIAEFDRGVCNERVMTVGWNDRIARLSE